MSSVSDAVAAKLELLGAVREAFVIRAESLPADLALVGLLNDLLDAARVALQLCKDDEPVAALRLARTAFEAAQRVIVLATDDDYVRVGARAWLYYLRKDTRIARFARGPEAAREWFETATRQLLYIWSAYNPEAETLLKNETERLDKLKGPDNFMGDDLGEVVESRYPKLVTAPGQSLPGLQNLNRAIYSALSNESHPRLRVDPAALQVAADGTVKLIPRKVDQRLKQNNVLGCLDSSLAEAGAALGYLMKEREQQHRDKIQQTANRLAHEPLPSTFKPDLGLHLMRSGGGSTTFHFPKALIYKLGILPDGTVTWSSPVTFGDQEFVATFDVPQRLVPDLAKSLDIEPGMLEAKSQLVKHTLVEPMYLQLQCRLGGIQKTEREAFVPLVATAVAHSRLGRVNNSEHG